MNRVLTAAGLWIAAAAPLRAEVDYQRDIRPLLATKCVACHGPARQEAGLRLDAGRLVRRGSSQGAVAIPGDAEGSLLWRRVTAEAPEERMPPVSEGEPLTPDELARLREWIESGLPSPADETFLPSARDHWAYRPIHRPDLPPRQGDSALAEEHPIDRLLSRHHHDQGLNPLPPADPLTLLRRVTLDLIGLPPTPAEQEAFLSDPSPAAYERLVDDLLARPQFGERWGRHWMDVWRYSDWDGYKEELRGSQRHLWRWRDWIIESLNAGKPYDRMIVEMLAGDEIAPDDPDTLRATGFLARNYHNRNRNIWLDAAVEHTAKGFLGLTLNCARCHDHKYDPLSQTDYYAFRAIFEPHQVRTDRLPGQPDLRQDGLPRVYDADLEAPTYLYRRGDEKQPDKEHPIPPGVPSLFDLPFEIQPVALPPIARFPALAEFMEQEDLAAAEARVRQRRDEWRALQEQFASASLQAIPVQPIPRADRPPSPALALRVIPELELAARRLRVEEWALEALRLRWRADRFRYTHPEQPDSAPEEFARLAAAAAAAERAQALAVAERDLLAAVLKYRGLFQTHQETPARRTEAIQQGLREITQAEADLSKAREGMQRSDSTYTPVGASYPATSSGRRLALARWIVDPRHPLTARVAVNQVWMRHFGRPLVVNVDDFGPRTPAPPLVDLLDWLAAEFIDSGWDLKHLHRLIVTSAAYRRASTGEPDWLARNAEIDSENRYCWRAEARRLEAEVIRDSLLAIGGRLDRTLGGPDLSFTQGEVIPRRSLYFQHAYEKQMTWLVLFDAASPTECYRRSVSIVPQQALALSNSNLGRSMARACVQSGGVGAADGDDRSFIEASFRRVLCRPPEDREVEACLAFLARQQRLLADGPSLHPSGGTVKATISASSDPALRAREDLIHVLMNHNDFVTVR